MDPVMQDLLIYCAQSARARHRRANLVLAAKLAALGLAAAIVARI